jgi:hypothetical protein
MKALIRLLGVFILVAIFLFLPLFSPAKIGWCI